MELTGQIPGLLKEGALLHGKGRLVRQGLTQLNLSPGEVSNSASTVQAHRPDALILRQEGNHQNRMNRVGDEEIPDSGQYRFLRHVRDDQGLLSLEDVTDLRVPVQREIAPFSPRVLL